MELYKKNVVSGKNKILEEIYTDIQNPAGFSSEEKLYREAKSVIKNVSRDDVKQFLSSQRSHTLHGNIPRCYKRRPIMVSGPGVILGSDLIDFGKQLSDNNDGFRYGLLLIDIFSRKIKIYLIRDKSNKTVAEKLDVFFENIKHTYKHFFSDSGGEYLGRHTFKIFEKYKITPYQTQNKLSKCAIAERCIRTIKTRLYKILTAGNTMKYLKYIPIIEETYNLTPHRGLDFLTPNYVDGIKDPLILSKLRKKQIDIKLKNYKNRGRTSLDVSCSKTVKLLQQGDYVRLLSAQSEQGVFHKSFKQNFTEEIFQIRGVNHHTHPTTYLLKDLKGDQIIGCVYKEELKKVVKPEIYYIEKIIKTAKDSGGNKKYFIKWYGYPESHNSWIHDLEYGERIAK